MAGPRPVPDSPRGRRFFRFVLPPLLMVGAVVAFVGLSNRAPRLDADLCLERAADVTGRTVALFDFRKPLNAGRRSLPAALLRGITGGLVDETELRVYILAAEAAQPRVFLERLCKPGPKRAGRSGRPDAGGEGWACADLAGASGAAPAPEMERFCTRRDALAARLDLLAATSRDAPVTDALLVEALEDTRLELAAVAGAKALYVMSDMIQHSDWYSHLELAPRYWAFERFAGMRAAQTPLFGAPPPLVPGLDTTLFYVPRRGVTEAPDGQRTHQAFWRAYFGDTVTFEEQPIMAGYPSEPLMGQPTELEVATRERERLELERERGERLRRQLERDNAALAEARERAAAERRELEARETRWEAEQETERGRVEAGRAKVERLKAELEARREGQ